MKTKHVMNMTAMDLNRLAMNMAERKKQLQLRRWT